jgi:hypothetical protein
LFRVINRYVGNLASMPGVFRDYPAPVIRNAGDERELIMMRSLGHAVAAAFRRPASHQYPEHVVTALARLAKARKPVSGPVQQLCRIRARAKP